MKLKTKHLYSLIMTSVTEKYFINLPFRASLVFLNNFLGRDQYNINLYSVKCVLFEQTIWLSFRESPCIFIEVILEVNSTCHNKVCLYRSQNLRLSQIILYLNANIFPNTMSKFYRSSFQTMIRLPQRSKKKDALKLPILRKRA